MSSDATRPLSAADLARTGLAMRKAQNAYFKKKAKLRTACEAELIAALDLEKRFDRMVDTALKEEQQKLPGMDDG